MTYTVGEAARIAHVSVRALHHYDELGLLRPSERTEAGYRLYSSGDLERLQQVLFYRELGFGLDEIKDMMAGEEYDRREALVAQRRLIEERALRLEAMLELIDRTLASADGRIQMSDEEMFDVFGEFDPGQYEDEVRERWSDTGAYRESARRTKLYTKQDWQRMKDEGDAIDRRVAALMDEGVSPGDPRAMDAAEEHRLLIDRWFYPCSHEMHAGLGAMYVADPRFTERYEKIHPGMAQYLSAAIAANAARAAE